MRTKVKYISKIIHKKKRLWNWITIPLQPLSTQIIETEKLNDSEAEGREPLALNITLPLKVLQG